MWGHAVRAVHVPPVVPRSYIQETQAEQACAACAGRASMLRLLGWCVSPI
jgi:hypothetical protein